ncbi:MAG: acyl-CoA thioester hydrolase/BAAT C-terminal domain-containing protein [Candidatus Dormibacteraceae bacterium]
MIPVERATPGRILLISAGVDTVWASAQMAGFISWRLRDHGARSVTSRLTTRTASRLPSAQARPQGPAPVSGARRR